MEFKRKHFFIPLALAFLFDIGGFVCKSIYPRVSDLGYVSGMLSSDTRRFALLFTVFALCVIFSCITAFVGFFVLGGLLKRLPKAFSGDSCGSDLPIDCFCSFGDALIVGLSSLIVVILLYKLLDSILPFLLVATVLRCFLPGARDSD